MELENGDLLSGVAKKEGEEFSEFLDTARNCLFREIDGIENYVVRRELSLIITDRMKEHRTQRKAYTDRRRGMSKTNSTKPIPDKRNT